MLNAHRRVFELLFAVAYMFHETEEWESPRAAIFSIVAVALLIYFDNKDRIRNWVFLTFLFFVAGMKLVDFPYLANHSNIILFMTMFLLPSRLLLCFRGKPIEDEEQITALRWAVMIVYFLAGFHKLNSGFFEAETGCSFVFANRYFENLGIPVGTWPPWLLPLFPLGTLAMELAPPLLLISARTRNLGIGLLALLHFLLAPIGFTDFSSLGMAFLWLFVPVKFLEKPALEKYIRGAVVIFLGMEVGFAYSRWNGVSSKLEFMEGVVLGLAFLPLWWELFKSGLKRPALSLPRKPLHALFLLGLLFFGMNNYLGLRTTGTFSMFSNLRTEGERSNHFVLASNPLKFFGFQEDVVKVLYVDPRVEGVYRHMPRAGQKIPLVEFTNVVKRMRWTDHPDIGIKIEYQGREIQTADLARDSQFDFPVPEWQKRLLTFRLIDESGPQRCLW